MSTPRYGDLFQQSWEWIREQLPLTAGLTLVYMVASGALHLVPIAGAFLAAALAPGYVVCLLRIRQKKPINFVDFFWCFNDFGRLLHYYLMVVLMTIAIVVGMIFLIVPGIYLVVALHLSSAWFVLRKQDAIVCLKASMDLVNGRWWYMAGLLLLLGLLNILGACFFVIGLLISVPLSVLVGVAAMEALENINLANASDKPLSPAP